MTDTNNIKVCPADGGICTMEEEDKHGKGCWLCPKIQELRDDPFDEKAKTDKADEGGESIGEEK